MKYMLLLYAAPDKEPAFGTPEFDKMMEDFALTSEMFEKNGVLVGGEGLEGVETATSLRIHSGKVETMDGPFAETRENLGGYYIVDVPDLDAALKCAAIIPVAKFGTIEVRPLLNYSEAD
ncbi:YciI family protein [Vibrio europaeus]|uniref:YciI family protein n=1 Tax=Vibrio europaeus TaxID=300876 RepID=A0A178J4G8_9VIBR|nr:YciI family protein [Vibrio europaeus]MDC5706187.1 YciI family protein [Vibrio europaeus]MDC5709597.1 YciI family protein [Vibrio europaeus]MDC5713996.1 YciI family protein [Vibrio europaeus]MDC5720735.1 YciI family protein [Vibrio europaeus]MDC5723395.1 YciI family protein [Vibrio europaeus]